MAQCSEKQINVSVKQGTKPSEPRDYGNININIDRRCGCDDFNAVIISNVEKSKSCLVLAILGGVY